MLRAGLAREDGERSRRTPEEHPDPAEHSGHRSGHLQAGQLVRRRSVHRARLFEDVARRPADQGRDPRDRPRRFPRPRLLGTPPYSRLLTGLHPVNAKGTRARLPQARRAFTQPRAAGAPGRGAARPGMFVDPEGLFTFLVLRPLSDLFLWLWRLERRAESL